MLLLGRFLLREPVQQKRRAAEVALCLNQAHCLKARRSNSTTRRELFNGRRRGSFRRRHPERRAYIICMSTAKASFFGNQCSRTGDYYSAFITIQSTLVQGRKKIGFWMFCSAPEDSANAPHPAPRHLSHLHLLRLHSLGDRLGV